MNGPASDRRRFPRAPLLGTAVLFGDVADAGSVFFVEDVSAGGVLVSGDVVIASGTPVRVLLSLAGCQPLRLLARVVRQEGARDGVFRLGLEFDRVAPEILDALQVRVLRALERQSQVEAQRGLVIHGDGDERRALVDDLRALGYPTLAVEAVPEAVDFLAHLKSPFAFAIADLSGAAADAVDLLALVRRRHPSMTCVLMGESVDQLARQRRFLGQCEVLARPWTREALWRAVAS